MYETKEIRWFFRSENKEIKAWFENLSTKTFEKRTDFYLKLTNEEIGVKTREGKIEIKHRVGTRAKGCLNPSIWGYYDKFVKWSFDINEDEAKLSKIFNKGASQWVPLEKERNVARFTYEDGTHKVKLISEPRGSDFHIEYSTLTVDNEIWHTCGLEWSGHRCINLRRDLISDIFGNSVLSMRQSKSYASFLAECKPYQRSRPFIKRYFSLPENN